MPDEITLAVEAFLDELAVYGVDADDLYEMVKPLRQAVKDIRAERDAAVARAEAAEAKVTPERLAAEIHAAWEWQYDECSHGTYMGGANHGEPYAMCEISAEYIAGRLAAASPSPEPQPQQEEKR